MKQFEKICKAVLKLNDNDFEEGFEMARKQEWYTHPLKMATATKTQSIGKNNRKIIKAIRDLKAIIEAGGKIVKG